MEQQRKHVLKLAIAGNSGVGKSVYVQTLAGARLRPSELPPPTVGVEFVRLDIRWGSQFRAPPGVAVNFWDTAGQEKFARITAHYLRSARGVVLAYSLRDMPSLDALSLWMQQIAHADGTQPPLVQIVATQFDTCLDRLNVYVPPSATRVRYESTCEHEIDGEAPSFRWDSDTDTFEHWHGRTAPDAKRIPPDQLREVSLQFLLDELGVEMRALKRTVRELRREWPHMVLPRVYFVSAWARTLTAHQDAGGTYYSALQKEQQPYGVHEAFHALMTALVTANAPGLFQPVTPRPALPEPVDRGTELAVTSCC